MNKSLFFLLLAFFIQQNISAQATCAAAVPVTVGTQQCGDSAGQVGDFPNAGGTPANPCAALYNDDEYWFSITGDGVNAIQVDLTSISATWAGVFIIDDCPANAPNCVISADNGSSTADLSVTTTNALANGMTYYIVIANYGTPNSTAFCLDVTLVAPSVVPANNECTAPVMVTVNPDQNCGTVVSGTTLLATETLPGCAGTANDDVWFSFVATGSIHSFDIQNIVATVGTSTNMVHEVFSGTCGALNSLGCSDPNSSTITGLTVGTTYFVRVYSSLTTSSQTFDLCIGTPPPPPANDSCQIAEVLSVQADACTTWTTGDNTTATNSGALPAPTCGSYSGSDMWFEVTVPASGNVTFDVQNVTWTSVAASLYAGTCGALVEEDCTEFGSGWPFVFTGLTPGTYFLRTWDFGNDQIGTYEICAFSTACTVTEIAAGTQTTCDPITNLYTQEIIVTFSSPPASGTLDINGQTFVVGTSPQTIVLTNLIADGSLVDVNVSFSGATTCALDSTDLFTAPANCLPPPINDLCIDAIAVALNPDETCTVVTGGTTQTATESLPGCTGTANDDVWFSFVATSSSHTFDVLNTTATSGTSTDMVHEIFSGSCGNLTSVDCNDPNSSQIDTLVVGTTYYVRVYSYFTSSSQTFNLCIGTPPLPPAPPTDNCGAYSSLPGAIIDDNNDPFDTISVSGTGMTIADLNVVLKIDHTWLSDLDIFLTSPSGATVDLIFDKCSSADDLEIEFDDEAGPLVCGAPTVGIFTPDGNLSDFDGEPFDGDWILSVVDDGVGDNGTLIQWCLIPQFCDLTVAVGATDVTCNAGTNGTATATPTNGVAPYTYIWSDGQTTATSSGLSAGLVSVTVTDGGGCTATGDATIVEPATAITELTAGNQTACDPATATYTQEVIVTYVMPPATGTLDINGQSFPIGTSPQTEILTLTADGIPVTVSASFSDNPTCTLDSVALFIAPSFCGTPSNNCGAYTSSPAKVIDGRDDLDAIDTITVTGVGFPLTDLNVIVEIDHTWLEDLDIYLKGPNGDTVTLILDKCGSNNDMNIEFDDEGGTLVCAQPTVGVYSPEGMLSDFDGIIFDGDWILCVFDDEKAADDGELIKWCLVPQFCNLALSVTSTDVNCNGGNDGTATAIPTNGVTPYTYIWSDGQSTATATGLSGGTATVTVSDSDGCTVIESVVIGSPKDLELSLTSTSLDCNGDNDANATAIVSGGTPPYSYLWTDGQVGATATGLSAGFHSVTVTDDNGCTINGTVSIIEPPLLSASATADTVTCSMGNDGSATVTTTGGTTPYSYTWNDGQTTPTATGLATGTYMVTVTDGNNCTAMTSIAIVVPDMLTAVVSSVDASCVGNADGSATAQASGGTSPYAYLWDTGAASQTTAMATGLAAGTYTVTITDSNSCTVTASATIDNGTCDFCDLASDGTIDICATITSDPSHPLATLDCDSGGILNAAECAAGTNPLEPSDDCQAAIILEADICAILTANPSNPLATADCDNGGIDNATECATGEDPSNPSDDCQAAIDGSVDICALINLDPSHPLSGQDCDAGGVDNYTECVNGGNPVDPSDDCEVAADAGLDICQIIATQPGTHPWTSLDCDNGGVLNFIECFNGTDPSNPLDDSGCPVTPCERVILDNLDVCAIIAGDPNSSLATLDCDNGGVDNATECANGGNPGDASDDCMIAETSGLDICAAIALDPAHPFASIDCDNGGIDNATECANGTDPFEASDDCQAAQAGGVNICMLINYDPNHPLASLDCDNGGIDNYTECISGEDPLDPTDDCQTVIDEDINVCIIIVTNNGNHPLASLDCDNGGVSNALECKHQTDPNDPVDDCIAVILCNINVCDLIDGDPNHPLADQDCDGGGMSNWSECEAGSDPNSPADDCIAAMADSVNICAIINYDPSHPLATSDCDNGGVPNWIECQNGEDPSNHVDDCLTAMDVNADICTIITINPTSPIATEDCDGGGVDNQTECDNGGNPTDPADDCITTIAEGEDICAVINSDPSHPMATVDCDNGGVDNYTECINGGDPADPTDDCMIAKMANLDICVMIGYDPAHPLASLDCDEGGVDNYTECVDGAGDPNDPMDDCESAVIAGLDLCAIINGDATHPWASLDCDNGGIINILECMDGGDPSDPIDDSNCPLTLCDQAEAGTIDICAEILLDASNPIGTLDCDGGGISNAAECAAGGDPLASSDDCMMAMTAGLDLCVIIDGDATHPLADLDCDGGGISNFDECASGENPIEASDDCQSAIDNGLNICQIINFEPTHPMASLDCDGGGITNWIECQNGGDPSISSDDCTVIVNAEIDICALLTDDPTNPIGSTDCDGDGVTNATECVDSTDPLDQCDFDNQSITLPVTADQSGCADLCPDLTPITTILPGNIAGASSVGVAVEITELNGIDTDGSLIIVRMPSDPRFPFTWDPTLTSVALTPVNNAVWTYLGDNGIVNTFRYNGANNVIGGGSTEAFGFQGIYDPQATDGQTTVTASIVPFGGGECNILNDTDSERLVYFE